MLTQQTYDKLKEFAEVTGMSMGGAVTWLIDNRPELKFKPLILLPRDPKQTDAERLDELQAFITAAENDDDLQEQWQQAQDEYVELMSSRST